MNGKWELDGLKKNRMEMKLNRFKIKVLDQNEYKK
jgi:hypothetical protein